MRRSPVDASVPPLMPATPLRVLAIDEDQDALAFYDHVLRAHGDSVVSVRDPAEALAWLAGEPADVAIVSLTLPAAGGLALVHHLRALYPDVDIVVAAGAQDLGSAAQAMSMGVNGYIVKPLAGDDVLLAIDRVREKRALLAERKKLVREGKSHLRRAAVVRRSLDMLEAADPRHTPVVILDLLVEELRGHKGVLFLTDPDDPHVLRREATRGDGEELPLIQLRSDPNAAAIHAGEPFTLADRPGSIFVPLKLPDQVVGLARVDRDRALEPFSGDEIDGAQTVAGLAAAALRNARRFEALERTGIKDPETSAYTFAYFVDHAGRELDKARRHGRQFSLVTITVDNYAVVRTALERQDLRELRTRLVEAMLEAVRDTDVLARVEDDEYYLLLPETGALGALTCRRRILERFHADAEVKRLDARVPIGLTLGIATYPADGADFGRLLQMSRARSERALRGPLRRLHLEDISFWEAVRALVGFEEQYAIRRDGSFYLHKDLRASEDAEGLSRHAPFPSALVARLGSELLGELKRTRATTGVVYLSESPGADRARLAEAARSLHEEGMRVWILGRRTGATEPARVAEVLLDDPRLDDVAFVLYLGERGAYALIGQRSQGGGTDGVLFGFHTADGDIVETLIVKLQEEYNLQRSLF